MKFLPYLLFTGLIAVVMMSNRCQTTDPLPKELYTTWVHSYEDDTDSSKVFRPGSYEFPPARGRERFTIQEDGTFLYYGIAPNDGYAPPTKGSWTATGGHSLSAQAGRENRFIISFQQLAEQEIIEVKRQ